MNGCVHTCQPFSCASRPTPQTRGRPSIAFWQAHLRCLPRLNVVLIHAHSFFLLPMNTFCTLAVLFFSTTPLAFAQTQIQPAQQKPVEQHLLGKISLSALHQAPFGDWFDKGYNDYSPLPAIIEKLAAPAMQKELSGTTIQVFLGTWCGDSKREVPRLIKVLNKAGVPEKNIELICLTSADSLYKQSPTHEERGREIYRVPTVVFSQNGKEIGRITEFPVESLERDLVAIISRTGYSANYRTYPLLQTWLQSGILADTNVSMAGLAAKLRHTVSTESELNSAAYVLLARGQTREAITIFRMNATLYPQSSNCFDSLAEGYEKAGNMLLAIKFYERAFELDPKNMRYMEKIVKLKMQAAK